MISSLSVVSVPQREFLYMSFKMEKSFSANLGYDDIYKLNGTEVCACEI